MGETDSSVMPSAQGPVVVALGSNLPSRWGSPAVTIQLAMQRLEALTDSGALQVSSLWQTKAQDCPPGTADFINAVALFTVPADETPQALLGKLQDLEQEFGRIRDGRVNRARILDLDLICFGDVVSRETGLILPHPRAHQRHFVLNPLQELAPQLILPGQRDSVSELLEKLVTAPSGLFKIDKNAVKCS